MRPSLFSGSFPSSWRGRRASRCSPLAIGATVDSHAKDGVTWRPGQLWEWRDHEGLPRGDASSPACLAKHPFMAIPSCRENTGKKNTLVMGFLKRRVMSWSGDHRCVSVWVFCAVYYKPEARVPEHRGCRLHCHVQQLHATDWAAHPLSVGAPGR